jgi:Uma2 family endonuclease
LTALVAFLLEPLSQRAQVTMLSGLRMQIEPQLFRIVDFALYLGARPEGRYATTPAHVAIEIVSTDDRFTRLVQKLEDYRRWGVTHIWLVDSELKRLYEYTEAGLLHYVSPALA